MKKIFLFLLVVVSAISCKKTAIIQDTMTASNERQIKNSIVSKGGETGMSLVETGMSLVYIQFHAHWYSYTEPCAPGWWYCWIITSRQDVRSYIKISNDSKLITFGIDNNINPDYHRQFINGSNFNFSEDTHINRSIVNAAIGLDKEIIVNQGLYHFENIDGILTITAPYSIVN